MEPNREQIIKALECCTLGGCHDCRGCPNGNHLLSVCKRIAMEDALSLIKELTEENERLREQNEKCQSVALKQEDTMQIIAQEKQAYYDELQTIKADTVRKMQERLKAKAKAHYFDNCNYAVAVEDIDQIAKEMLEGDTNEHT